MESNEINEVSRGRDDDMETEDITCPQCTQRESEIQTYNHVGHINSYNSNETQCIATFKDVEMSIDDLPKLYVSSYCIYDKEDHLCALDSMLVEAGVDLYLCAVVHKGEADSEGVIVHKAGPISEWWLEGYDGQNSNNILLTTDLAEYTLLEPHAKYLDTMETILERKWITKWAIEFLEANDYRKPTYTSLLQHLTQKIIPENKKKVTEDMLTVNAGYVCEVGFELDQQDPELKLMMLPCMKDLFRQSGMKKYKPRIIRHKVEKVDKVYAEESSSEDETESTTKATATPLISETFESLFSNVMDKVELQEQNGCSKGDNNESFNTSSIKIYPFAAVSWVSNGITHDEKTFHTKVKIGNAVYKQCDFVIIKTTASDFTVGRIEYMYEKHSTHQKLFHCQLFMQSHQTILGFNGRQRELFMVDDCQNDIPISCIVMKTNVILKNQKQIVNRTCGLNTDEAEFICEKFYNRFTARFENLPVDESVMQKLNKQNKCCTCERQLKSQMKTIPTVKNPLCSRFEQNIKKTDYEFICYDDKVFKKNTPILLMPNAVCIPDNYQRKYDIDMKKEKIDEIIYPEAYRKLNEDDSQFSFTSRKTYVVAIIEYITVHGSELLTTPQNIYIKVRILYRPENTLSRKPQFEDLNKVYWSNHIEEICFTAVVGMCELFCTDNTISHDFFMWLEEDPTRFYFDCAYDHEKKKIMPLPKKNFDFRTHYKPTKIQKCEVEFAKLKTIDLFAGCGGLSEGLHQSGVSETKWAIENDPEAANAFSLNNPDCVVICDDCNIVLKNLLKNQFEHNGKMLPKPGEVDMVCGGPPCQGFSGMNRFSSRQYSTLQNSMIVTFLSFCDFYRPQYIMLENVRNFVQYSQGMAVKLCMRALLTMGYQCTFAILQAGSYGVPQSRRRLILLAAAPTCPLPQYPEPTTVFNRNGCKLSCTIDGKVYNSNIKTYRWALRRTCTVFDVMCDLPPIESGSEKEHLEYLTEPETHFQKMVRIKSEDEYVRDHICKKVSPLVQARINSIPKTPGSDWRDLPNIEVELSDGTKSKILQYMCEDTKNGKSSKGNFRGICPCASGKKCDPACKQDNTLIPWGMAHTANRNNNWSGIYGRLSWMSYFRTTVTDPEPSGKQGRVLHPEQDRVVSVRECARSQGMPDHFRFSGSMQDKYRQIGNAVPPPLAAAIGKEIKKAIIKRMSDLPKI